MRALIVLTTALPLLGQIPAQDSRNTDLPGTDTHFRMPEYKTLGEWQARREHLRKQILTAAGLLPMPEKTPLQPRIFGRIDQSDYSIEKILLETLPGYYLGGNLYRPRGKSGKFPAVVSPHGHWNYGRLEHTPTASVPARAISLARQGYIVFTQDMVGYNDTVQTPHAFGREREQLWGFGPLGLQLWNSIRVVDFLLSLEDVDPARIGATGASGGGTQTFLLTAVDERVSFSAPVNMLSAIMQGGSPCENAPNLRVNAFNLEFGAMMAPRPMLMVSATGDWTRNTPTEEFPAVQAIYRLYGAADKLATVQIDAPHNYNQASREAVYRFFAQHAQGRTDAARIEERGVRPEKLQDLLALHNRTLPENALKYDQVVQQWIAAAQRQNGAPDRERLALALAAEWPREVLSQTDGERIVLGRTGARDRVPGISLRGSGRPAVVVHPDGAAAARKLPEVEALVKSGRPVLLIDAFQTGSAVAPRDRSGRHFLTFNKSDDANRVQDILTAVAYLSQQGAAQLELYGFGKAAVWCTFAGAVSQAPVRVHAPLGDFRGSDEDFIRDFFVPGIQRAGGLKAALALLPR
jgi:dienelactone hydrolase